MELLIFCGVVAFVTGIFFLFFSENLRKLNVSLSKAVNFDDQLFRLRIGVGVAFVLVSVMCFFLVYYVVKRHG